MAPSASLTMYCPALYLWPRVNAETHTKPGNLSLCVNGPQCLTNHVLSSSLFMAESKRSIPYQAWIFSLCVNGPSASLTMYCPASMSQMWIFLSPAPAYRRGVPCNTLWHISTSSLLLLRGIFSLYFLLLSPNKSLLTQKSTEINQACMMYLCAHVSMHVYTHCMHTKHAHTHTHTKQGYIYLCKKWAQNIYVC